MRRLLSAFVLCVACRRTEPGPSTATSAVPTPSPQVATTAASPSPAPLLETTETGAGTGAKLLSVGPGIPVPGPFLTFYGPASAMGDLQDVASRFRVIDLDADPGVGGFTDAQLAVLRAGGKNRVLSYLNLGACERFRTYWTSAPAGFVPCGKNTAAKLGAYDGYPDETWMDPSNAEYRRLIVDHVAARIAARGVDGFYLDNLELLSHAPNDENGPCSAACRQGGLDLVRELRTRYPALVLVMQNGTGPVTRLGTTGGVRFATLLDGIAHEEVWKPAPDPEAEAELVAWRDLGLRNGQGTPFWIGTVDYVGGCNQVAAAREVFDKSRARGFSPWVSDASDKQQVVCRWPF